ncbi:hypothetical protein FEP50_05344 [Burkholderia multivorans]|nr:hypothetical protein [Burkholderia multivorans]
MMETHEQHPHDRDRQQRRAEQQARAQRDGGGDVRPRQRICERPSGLVERAAEHDVAAAEHRLVGIAGLARDVEIEQPGDPRVVVRDARAGRHEPVVGRCHEERAVGCIRRHPRQQVIGRVFGHEHGERLAVDLCLRGDPDAPFAGHGIDERRQPAHVRTAVAGARRCIAEIDAQRVQRACPLVRRREAGSVAARVRHEPEHRGARAVVIADQRIAAIDRTRRADPREQHRQRQVARDFAPVGGLPRHAEHDRRIRRNRDLLIARVERIDDAVRRAVDVPPDQLRVRYAVAERRLADLDFVQRLYEAREVIAPLAVEIAVDDRRHPERTGDQDQDRDDDAAAEHRNVLIASNRLERTVRHDIARATRHLECAHSGWPCIA